MRKSNRYQVIIFFIMPFLLSWPAWFNGQPFLFADTTAYIRGGASALDLVLKTTQARAWLDPVTATTSPSSSSSQQPVATDRYSSTPDKGGVIAGRSIYYGFFVFATTCLLGLGGVPLLQALVSVCLIVSVVRARFAISDQAIALGLLLLAIASPLPFFNSLIMPDVFVGLGIIAAAALLLLPQAAWRPRIFWSLMVLASALFHTGNTIIILEVLLTLVILSLLVRRRAPPLPLPMLALVVAMIALGIAGESLFNYAVKRLTHMAPIRPPFITARLLADGPGNDFVAQHCAGTGFEVCKYPRDFTRGTSDDFLWSRDPGIGVFTLATKESRQLLGQQDLAFAKAVLLDSPAAVLKNSLRNVGEQLGHIGLQEFVYLPDFLQSLAQKIPPGEQRALERSRAATGRFDVRYEQALIEVASVLSLLVCAVCAARGLAAKRHDDFLFVAIILLSLVINAGICGALSTPHDRYQARIMWVPELLALVIVGSRFRLLAASGAARAAEPAPARDGGMDRFSA